MVDGELSSSEIRELKEVKRYTLGNMDDDAVTLYTNFMTGSLGEKGHKKDKKIDIVGKAQGMLATKNINGQTLVFDIEDIKELLLLSIKDGSLNRSKVDHLINVKDILNNRVTQEGANLFLNFARAYHKRLYPDDVSQQTRNTSPTRNQPRETNRITKPRQTQCGYCYGSGSVTCSSCYGMGGQSETRTEYDYDGNVNYHTEFVNCYSCNGGYSSCGPCGGSGQVYN